MKNIKKCLSSSMMEDKNYKLSMSMPNQEVRITEDIKEFNSGNSKYSFTFI